MKMKSIPSKNWTQYIFSDIISLIGGGTPKTTNPEYWNGDIPWLSVKDFNNEFRYVYKTEKNITQLGLEQSSTKLLEKDDIIISARGTVGEIAMIPYPMAFNQSCYGIKAKGNLVDNIFLYYLLKNSIRTLKNNAHGCVFDTITRDTFDGLVIELPPLPIQKKIASILSSLDDKIELNTRMNTVLEEIARALFHRWFVEFKFPNADGRPYQSAGGKMVEYKMGCVPEGWKVGTIGDVVNRIFSGGTPKTSKSEYWDGEFPWFSSGETRSHFVISTEKSITKDGVDNSSTKLAKKHDVVIASAGQGFTRGQTSYLLLDTYVNQSVIVIHGDIPIQTYVYMSLSGRYNELRGISDSSSIRGSLTTKMIGKFPLIIPPRDLIEEYAKIVQSIIIQIEINLHENKRLTHIRDALLPKLMSGDLSVPFPSTNDVGTGGTK